MSAAAVANPSGQTLGTLNPGVRKFVLAALATRANTSAGHCSGCIVDKSALRVAWTR